MVGCLYFWLVGAQFTPWRLQLSGDEISVDYIFYCMKLILAVPRSTHLELCGIDKLATLITLISSGILHNYMTL